MWYFQEVYEAKVRSRRSLATTVLYSQFRQFPRTLGRAMNKA